MGRNGSRFSLPRLLSGGIITNYDCTSRCRYCLYACSPRRPRDSISEETLRPLLRTIRSRGGAPRSTWAAERHGIVPAGSYLNRCHLCHDIRARLVRSEGASCEELHPASFYDEAVT